MVVTGSVDVPVSSLTEAPGACVSVSTLLSSKKHE